MQARHAITFVVLLAFGALAGGSAIAQTAVGWRGNGTGLWPDARPPLQWHRTARGALEGLCASVARPTDNDKPDDAPLVAKGALRDWLVIGPFAVDDSIKDFDRDVLGGEATVMPVAGQMIAGQTWQSMTSPPDDIYVFGTAEIPYLDLLEKIAFAPNQVAYAHTWLFSPRGGTARIVVDHSRGLKAWVNGKEVYRSTDRQMMLGYYTQLSRYELAHEEPRSPRFEFELKQGWNRLLLKLSTTNRKEDFKEMRCSLRIVDPPGVAYESDNILWMTPLRGRSTSTPIIVGDRVFVMAEPDELTCIDKHDGRVLWTRAINFYEAMPPAEKQANPAFAQRIDPLVTRLMAETDRAARLALRRELGKELIAIDAARFKIDSDGHFEAHFGIVGFTMPTPVSDGKHVYVWCGMGVAACFDLEGNRKWITRIDAEHLTYGSSPALAEGVLAVYLNGLYGIDAATGKVRWTQPVINRNVGALLATTIAGQPYFVTQRGDLVRPGDGSIVYRPQGSSAPGDVGWAPPVVLGDRIYQPKYGVNELTINDYSAADAGKPQPKVVRTLHLPRDMAALPDGRRVDMWTAGSPLVWDDVAYQVNIYQTLYSTDIRTGEVFYRADLPLEGFTHYNAVAVAASPTLIGGHVYICDNQGTMLVIDPGAKFNIVARNRIGTTLDRPWPIPAQETIGYAPPIVDGDRIYIRGETNLYCIGKN